MTIWREAAASAGLQDVQEGGDGASPEIRARSGPLTVQLQPRGKSRRAPRTRVTITGMASLVLRPESLRTAVDKSLGAREVEIGDEDFDRAVWVNGPPEMACALLD